MSSQHPEVQHNIEGLKKVTAIRVSLVSMATIVSNNILLLATF